MEGITLTRAEGAADMAVMAGLMRDYLVWHHARYAAFRAETERYFDHKGYQAEIDGLPGDYAPPRGCILLARQGGAALGCVALRDRGEGIAEMRRMYVAPAAQGRGLGKALARAIMDEARALGYRRMRLDTGPLQHEAVAMYRSLGFQPIAPYFPVPAELAQALVFMECDLGPA